MQSAIFYTKLYSISKHHPFPKEILKMTDPTLQAAITAVGAGTQSAEQAAMVNAAYRNDQMPVLAPVAPSSMNADFTNLSQAQRAGAYSQEGNNLILTYDTTGLSDPRNQQGRAVYLTPTEYQAKFGRTPEQYEQTKYNIFNNPSAVDPNTIPSDLRPSYDTAMQDRVHDYFRANPSAAFLEINRQYDTIKSGTVYSGGQLNWASGGMQLSDPSEEAGGPVFSGRAAIYAEKWYEDYAKNPNILNSGMYDKNAKASDYASLPRGSVNPFKEDSAAGIAWDVAATGGYVGKSLSDKVVDPDTGKRFDLPSSWVDPQVDTGNVVSTNPLVSVSIAPGRNVYVPIGEMEQQLRTDAKLIVADRGAYEVWQTPKNTMPGLEGYFTRIYPMITAGGSDFALQSGMVSGKAATPWVVDEYGMTGLWKASDAARVKDIQEHPELYSRLGSELYGGIVQKLNPAYPYNTIEAAWGRGQIVEPGVYPDVRENFASLVKFGDVNAPKGSVSDASDLPKFGSISPQQFAEMPALQRVDNSGNLSPAASMATIPAPFKSVSSPALTAVKPDQDFIMIPASAGNNAPTLSPTFGLGAMAAEDGTNATITYADGTPFNPGADTTVKPTPSPDEYQPSGFLGLGGLLPEMPSGEQAKAYLTSQQWQSDPLGAMFKFSIDTYTAPVSTASGVASRLSSELTDFIYKPAPIVVDTGSSRLTKTETFDLPTVITREEMNLPGSSVRSGGNQTITDLGAWLIGSRGSIDQTDKAAVDDYNKKADTFTKMQEQNPVFVTTTGGTKTIVTESGGQRIVTTESGESGKKVYATEWDRFVEGSGRVGRWVTGYTLERQNERWDQIKDAPGVGGEFERASFIIGTTIVNKPAELAPAAILGVTLQGAARMAPGFLAEVGAGTGLTARAATVLSTPGGTSLAKVGLVGLFGGAYTYDVTEGLSASPETTKKNIYSSLPGLYTMLATGGGLDTIGEYARRSGTPVGTSPTNTNPINDNRISQGHSDLMSRKAVGLTEHLARGDLVNNLEGFNKLSGFGGVSPSGGVRPVTPEMLQLPTKATPMNVVDQSAGGMYAHPEAVGTMTWDAPLEGYAKGYTPYTVSPVGTPSSIQEITAFIEPTQRPLAVNEMNKGWVDSFYPSKRAPLPQPQPGEPGWGKIGSKPAYFGTDPEILNRIGRPTPQPLVEQDAIPNPLNPKRGYAPAPLPLSIPGVSDIMLQRELANINPAFFEDTRVSAGGRTTPQTLIEREYPYTEIERTAFRPTTILKVSPLPAGFVIPSASGQQSTSELASPTGETFPGTRQTVGIIPWNRDTVITPTGVPRVTEITIPWSKDSTVIVPYTITTPRETTITDIREIPQEYPWERFTETPQPQELITPLPPAPVIPIPWLPALPNLGGGGGTGASARGRGPKRLELFSFAPRKLPKWKMPKVKI
jgi:hypothetical protein